MTIAFARTYRLVARGAAGLACDDDGVVQRPTPPATFAVFAQLSRGGKFEDDPPTRRSNLYADSAGNNSLLQRSESWRAIRETTTKGRFFTFHDSAAEGYETSQKSCSLVSFQGGGHLAREAYLLSFAGSKIANARNLALVGGPESILERTDELRPAAVACPVDMILRARLLLQCLPLLPSVGVASFQRSGDSTDRQSQDQQQNYWLS